MSGVALSPPIGSLLANSPSQPNNLSGSGMVTMNWSTDGIEPTAPMLIDTSNVLTANTPQEVDIPFAQQALITDLLNKYLGVTEFSWDKETEEAGAGASTVINIIKGLEILKKEFPQDDLISRQISQLYLGTIIDFMSIYATQDDKFSILKEVIHQLINCSIYPTQITKLGIPTLDKSVFGVDNIIFTLASKINLSTPNDEIVWRFSCKFIKKFLVYCQGAPLVRLFRPIFLAIQSLPNVLTRSQVECAQKGVRLMESFVHRTKNYISHYSIITEVTNITKVHWVLSGFVSFYIARRNNLAALLSLDGSYELCRIIGASREEEFFSRKRVPMKHQIFLNDPMPPPCDNIVKWNRSTQSLQQLLCEGVAFYLIKSQVASNTDLKMSTSSPSDSLLHACITRTLQLIQSTESRQQLQTVKSEDGRETWWEEWQLFADQFYAFVENGLLNYEQFVIQLSNARIKGKPIRDNGVIFLLTQCVPLDPIKNLLKQDIEKKVGGQYGHLIPMIMNFHNKDQVANPVLYHDVRDTSMTCFMFRVYNIVGLSPADVKKYIQVITDKVQSYKVHQYRKWWTDKEKSGDTPEFYNLNPKVFSAVCVISNFMSQPIAQAIFDFLQKSDPEQLAPGELPFRGKTRPLPVHFLAHLSIRSRQRVLEHIETIIYKNSVEIKSPGIVETYARLLYTSPGSRNKYKLQNNLRQADLICLHTLVELLNFRLLRYFIYHSATKELFLDIFECLLKWNNLQMFRSLENLLLKICLHLRYLLKFAKATETVAFGEMLNRNIILTLAKALKTKGISEYGQLKELPGLISRLYSLSPHVWSANTIKYFPSDISVLYEAAVPAQQQITRDNVKQEFAVNKTNWRGVGTTSSDKSVESFIKYYNDHPPKKSLFLCVVWLFVLEHKRSDAIAAASKVIATWSPIEQTQNVYSFIDFLLDESPLQQKPLSSQVISRSAYSPEIASPEVIRDMGKLLSAFIWTYRIFDFEAFILALIDRDEDPNMYQLLEYLLLEDPPFMARVDHFLSLQFNKDFWKEDQFYNKQQDFYTKFPEPKGQPLLPIYYGNVVLRFLPVLELVLGRLVENSKDSLVIKLIDRYHELFKYHENSAGFLVDFLNYYYEAPIIQSIDVKSTLLKLIQVTDLPYTDTFNQYVSSRDPQIFTSQYFEGLVTNLANSLQPDPCRSVEHLFQELPTTTQKKLTTILLEILILPFSPKDITDQFMMMVFNTRSISDFQHINSLSMILGSLPKIFHKSVRDISIMILKSDKLLINSDFPKRPILEPIQIGFVTDYTTNSNRSLDTNISKVVMVMQQIFHYSSIDTTNDYAQFIRELKPFLSLQQLYIIVKIISPFIYRISGNTILINEILLEIFNGLIDLNDVIHVLSCSTFYDNPIDPRNPLVYLEMITDFFYHCKKALPKLDIFALIPPAIKSLCPELQSQFKHL